MILQEGSSAVEDKITYNPNLFNNTPEVQLSNLPPLVSALKTAAETNVASFHFPGHNRGLAAPSSLSPIIGSKTYTHDLCGIPELGNLFFPQGPVFEAQKEAAKVFGSSQTWFLVGGTTSGIQTAIMSTCSPGDYLILPRNCHVSAISGIVLSGAVPKYIFTDSNNDWNIPGGITPSQVLNAIKEVELEGKKLGAVFITSPTYNGICSNLREISEICHSRKIPLIVDEAHGAHLGFHPDLPRSALQQGADLAVQSTHKVLCSLTQSSMLHMSGDIIDKDKIQRCIQSLQSSSHSYLLMASLDAATAQLRESADVLFNQALELANEAKLLLKQIPGISVLEHSHFPNFPAKDPLRITVGFWKLGLSGYEADKMLLNDFGITRTLVGTKSVAYSINLGTSRDHVHRLVSGIKHLATRFSSIKQPKETHNHAPLGLDDIIMRLSPREAYFASKIKVSAKESIGKVSGELLCPFPPAVPVVVPGEVITQKAIDFLLHSKSTGASISGASDPSLTSVVVCNGDNY